MYNFRENHAKKQGFFGFVVWKSYCEWNFRYKTSLSCIHKKRPPNKLNRHNKTSKIFRISEHSMPEEGPTSLVVLSIEITTGEDQRISRIAKKSLKNTRFSVK